MLKKILIICSDADIKDFLVKKVSDLGFEPFCISDACRASTHLFVNRKKYSAIILNLAISIVGGEKADSEVGSSLLYKLQQRIPDIPVVILAKEDLPKSFCLRGNIHLQNLKDTSSQKLLDDFLLCIKEAE